MAGKSLSNLISSFSKDKASTFFKENYKTLFGDQFDLGSLQKLVTETYEDFTSPSAFKRMKDTTGVTDPEIYKNYIDSFNVPEDELLRRGYTETKQRFIGRSPRDLLDEAEALNGGNSKFRNERTISGTLFDKATELDFNSADDFKIFENLYDFNEKTYGSWTSPKSTVGNINYISSKKDFFDQYIEYYKDKHKLSETGAIKKLQEIEQKAKEMNLSGYDFGDMIEKRKVLNQEYKANRHEAHQMNREYKIKIQRLDDIEQEMKNFRMNSPEYKALEREYNNVYADLYSGSGYNKEVLQLNAPREGAPMFEGGAVPSVIADSADYDQHTIYTQDKFEEKLNTNSQQIKRRTLKNGDRTYRPKVTMNGNNVEIDSIYNHSTPTAKSAVNVTNNTSTPIDNLNKILNKKNPERRMWTNRDFVFGDNYINNKDFNRAVTEFYTNTENAENLFEKIARFSDLEYSPNDFKIYENMFDTYKRATGQTTKDVQQQIINQFKEWKVGPEEIQRHFRLIKEAAEEVGWQGSYEHLDYSSFKIDVDTPDPESYKPKIGDNIINSETGERYVLSQIDKADPDLDIHNDTYYYNSPNGERLTRTSPIDPNKNSNYKFDYDNILSPDDVRRINNSFNDLETNTNLLDEAKSKLSSLKDQFDNGADNLNEIYQTEKAVRNLESKVANARMQIDEDDLRYNSNGKYAYNINEKTRKHMEKADNLLGDYSETKYVNDYKEIFKEVKPRQFINSIDPGVDDAFNLINEASVENNIKARTRTRGKKKNAQLTGRGNKKRRIQSTGRGNKNTIKTRPKKAPTLKRRGKSSKFRAVGRNGKVLNNIPRKAIPLNKKDIVKTAANLIVNEAATNTANTIIKNIDDINTPNVNNAPHPDSSDIPSVDNPIPEPDHSNTPEPEFEIPSGYSDDPSTWTDEDIADMADGDPDLYEELKKRREEAFNNNDPETHTNTPEPENNSGPQGEPIPPKPFSKDFDPNDPDTWTRDDIERMNNPSIWTDDDIKLLADGDPDYAEELKARKGTNDGPRQGPDDFRFHTDDAPIPERNKIDTPDTKMFDEDGLPQGLSKMDIAMTGLNILGAVGDYKSARREGHGVVSSAVRAGAKFAIDEALGWWALPIGIVKTLPGAAIKGADMLYKENRRMNSAANFQVFGDAQFMDTQQLATMRQSGMEMAKMAQYNLQQTLMGSEAKYLHR